MGRDMDRGNAVPRGRDLCREVAEWKTLCQKLSRLPSPFSIKAGMDIMRAGSLHSMRGDNNDAYGCMGVLRNAAGMGSMGVGMGYGSRLRIWEHGAWGVERGRGCLKKISPP